MTLTPQKAVEWIGKLSLSGEVKPFGFDPDPDVLSEVMRRQNDEIITLCRRAIEVSKVVSA